MNRGGLAAVKRLMSADKIRPNLLRLSKADDSVPRLF